MEEPDSHYPVLSVLTLFTGKQYVSLLLQYKKTFCVGVINIVELLKQSPKFQVNNSNF